MKTVSLVKLTIKNAEFYAYHGVKNEEKKLGGKYQIDLDLHYNPLTAVVNDDVNYALNYEEAMFTVQEIITSENFNLIETLANEILEALFDKFDSIMKATVRVRKYSVPMAQIIDYVEVEQSIERLS
jgi:dihydroneopterin aldolase